MIVETKPFNDSQIGGHENPTSFLQVVVLVFLYSQGVFFVTITHKV